MIRGPEEKLRALVSSGRWDLNAVSAVWNGDEEDATLRAQDILALNRVPNPFAIPAGTVLRLARPTSP